MAVHTTIFGTTREGQPVHRFLLKEGSYSAAVIEYGATLQAVLSPDRQGRPGPVLLGFDRLENYEGDHPYLGSTVGRFANRLAGAEITLDGQSYPLIPNEGRHQLHGGPRGFHRAVWRGAPWETGEDSGVILQHISPDGDQGYPGRMEVRCRYQLTPSGELRITYQARTDKTTVVNLTSHAYWNLRGTGTVMDHQLELEAESFLEIDSDLIPTGRRVSAAGSPFDFRTRRPLGSRIEEAGGYDHCYLLSEMPPNKSGGKTAPLRRAARLSCPVTGRTLTVSTDRPGMQLYTGEGLNITAAGGQPFGLRQALCLECQDLPDSPHHPDFPSPRLDPGQLYRACTVYQLGVQENGD